MIRQISRRIIRMNVSDTRKLDQTKLVLFQVYERHLWIMRFMSLAYRRRCLRRPDGRPKRKIGYVVFFVAVFGSVFFFETASPYFIANLFYASFKTTVRLKRISRLIDRHTIRWINAWCLSKWIYSLDALLGIKYC